MATWQAEFRFVAPSAGLPLDYRTRFGAVLPAGRSWSAEIEQWGVLDGDCIEVSGEPSHRDIRCRFDLRRWRTELYEEFLGCLRGIGGDLETSDGQPVQLDLPAFEQALRASPAARFVANPAGFLADLREGRSSER
jgi:hypothetical protein